MVHVPKNHQAFCHLSNPLSAIRPFESTSMNVTLIAIGAQSPLAKLLDLELSGLSFPFLASRTHGNKPHAPTLSKLHLHLRQARFSVSLVIRQSCMIPTSEYRKQLMTHGTRISADPSSYIHCSNERNIHRCALASPCMPIIICCSLPTSPIAISRRVSKTENKPR